MKETNALHAVLVLGLYLALLGAGTATSYFLSKKVDVEARSYISEQASIIALGISPELVDELEGSEADLQNPSYDELKTYLARVRTVDEDIRFVYLLGMNEEQEVFFYGDSESPESIDYSPPGQVYFEATPLLRSAFTSSDNLTEGPERDRWGLWISGYAPVLDVEGTTRAVVGVDVPADDYLTQLVVYSIQPLVIAIVIVFLIVLVRRRR